MSVSAFKEVSKYSAQHPAEQDSDHTSWSSGELTHHTFGPVLNPGCYQRQWWSQSREQKPMLSIKNCINSHQHFIGLGSITRNANSPCMQRFRISKSPQCCWPKGQSGDSCLQWNFTADLPVLLWHYSRHTNRTRKVSEMPHPHIAPHGLQVFPKPFAITASWWTKSPCWCFFPSLCITCQKARHGLSDGIS